MTNLQTESWLPPTPGPAVRGTVILLPGRGEHAGVYERFGRRLAFDAYAVHAISVSPDDDPADLRDQVAALAAEAVAPVVLAGSDTGALHALALVIEHLRAARSQDRRTNDRRRGAGAGAQRG